MMDLDQFWGVIEQARSSIFAAAENRAFPESEAPIVLTDTLSKLSPQEIIAFYQRYEERVMAAYHWDLWGALFIFTEGCASDDRFEHFRAELILCGRHAFEAALANADSLCDFPGLPRGTEGLIYVPLHVYEQKTGRMFPQDLPRPTHPSEPAGERWLEEDLPNRLPRMWARFGEESDEA